MQTDNSEDTATGKNNINTCFFKKNNFQATSKVSSKWKKPLFCPNFIDIFFAFSYIDAMAYRGDLIGCTIRFERETNGKVPVVFTLNGRRITEDEIWIDYTSGGKLMYPYIAMGHQGIRVLAKVCIINSDPLILVDLINLG